MSLETLPQTGQNIDDISNELHELVMEFNDNDQDLQQERLKDSPIHSKLRDEWLVTKDTHHGNLMAEEYESNWWKDIDKATLNSLIIKWMKKDWLKMRENKPYEIKDMLRQDKNTNSNGIINLENKTIQDVNDGGWTPIRFKTYEELFDVVQLTLRIRDTFSGREAKSKRPFHLTAIWRIEFDNVARWKFRKGDVDILKRRSMKEISPTLRENKEFYIKYLNKWRENWGRVPWVY